MTISKHDQEWFDRDSDLTVSERGVVTKTLDALRDIAALDFNIPLANDDRAGALEAALIKYIILSRAVV